MKTRRIVDAPRDVSGFPVTEPLPPAERERRLAELGRALLELARRGGYLPPEREVEQ